MSPATLPGDMFLFSARNQANLDCALFAHRDIREEIPDRRYRAPRAAEWNPSDDLRHFADYCRNH